MTCTFQQECQKDVNSTTYKGSPLRIRPKTRVIKNDKYLIDSLVLLSIMVSVKNKNQQQQQFQGWNDNKLLLYGQG